MANTRYTAAVDQINADMRMERGRTVSVASIDRALSRGSTWFANLNPDGWAWQSVYMTVDAATESLAIRQANGTAGALWKIGVNDAPEPLLDAGAYVATQVGASTGEYKKLQYLTWDQAVQRRKFNRLTDGYSESGSSNQKYWTYKVTQTGVATTVPQLSIETFPFKYAGATNPEKLYYELSFKRQMPVIATGDNADDSFLWDDTSYDSVITYFAEAVLAHQLGDTTIFQRAWNLARELARVALLSTGVAERRLHLPPPQIKTLGEIQGM